nr:MAG TPA: hypothetical protein [Caudoviricetes sp.]
MRKNTTLLDVAQNCIWQGLFLFPFIRKNLVAMCRVLLYVVDTQKYT